MTYPSLYIPDVRYFYLYSALCTAFYSRLHHEIRAIHLTHDSAFLREQRAQHRAMATRLVLAITAHGEIRLMRQGGKQIQSASVFRCRHFRSIPLLESSP